jgi:hypothetical protein
MAVKNLKYPFLTGEDLKNSGLSDIDIAFNIENLDTGLRMAVTKLKHIISDAVFNAIMNHYNSDAYQKPDPTADEKLLDSLVLNMQYSLSPFAFLETFVWRRLRVKNSSITVVKNDSEDRPYKYDLDEAKDSLYRIGWTFTTELFDLLNTNINNAISPFAEWKISKQYIAMQALVIRDYKEFNEFYFIDHNAAFFVRAIGIQRQIIEEDINPRLKIIYTVTEDDPVQTPDTVLKLIKSYLANMVMSRAAFSMDAYYLPDSLRNIIENEQYRKKGNNNQFVKEKLSANIAHEAKMILDKLDLELASLKELEEGESYTDEFESTYEDDDKFIFPS